MATLFSITGLLSYLKKDLDCVQFARLGTRVYVLKLSKNATANQMELNPRVRTTVSHGVFCLVNLIKGRFIHRLALEKT